MNPYLTPTAPDPRFPTSWRPQAACLGHDTSLWFPDSYAHAATRAARQVCTGCPVRRDCLHHALTTPENHGIWGGITETRRRRHHAELLTATRAQKDAS